MNETLDQLAALDFVMREDVSIEEALVILEDFFRPRGRQLEDQLWSLGRLGLTPELIKQRAESARSGNNS